MMRQEKVCQRSTGSFLPHSDSKLSSSVVAERTSILTNQRQALANRAECPNVDCLFNWYESELAEF